MTDKNNTGYSKFMFEDFLQDDFFIHSTKYPTKESDDFWEKYKKDNPECIAEFNAAKQFVADINAEQLSDKETSALWNSINTNTHRRKIHNAWYVSIAVAASIAALLVFWPFSEHLPSLNETQIPDIMAFATEQLDMVDSIGEAKLILSNNKTILLTDKESVIKYDSTVIRVSAEEVSKEESNDFNQLIIPHGKRSMLTFLDGTKIWVNAGTRVIYPVEFAMNKREIYVDGEVYLDVSPDSKRPFIVRTNDMNIQVMGTKFNIQAYGVDMQKKVALETGSVKITSNDNSNTMVLKPNDMYEYNNGKEIVTQVDIRQYVSWVKGLYLFESERLEAIFTRLSRYYGKEISIDAASAELMCSGKLDMKEKLEDVLDGLVYTAPIRYKKTGETYLIKYYNH